jgi:tryptophanyl-tRNA synthetase
MRALHIGHYAAVLTDLLRDQYAYPGAAYVFVADHHARSKWSTKDDFVSLGGNTLDTARGLLALGLDPNYCVIYRQSDIPELFELMWFFAGLLGDGWLRRGVSFKSDPAPTVGTYLYPLLMVSDILSLKATHVAIGRDQTQHIELARELGKKLVSRFGKKFLPIPESLKTEPVLVPGIDSSDSSLKKMAAENGNEIPIFAEEDIIQEKIEGITTRPVPWGTRLPVKGCNIINYANCLGGKEAVDEFTKRYLGAGYGYDDAKRDLRTLFFTTFSVARQKYARLRNEEVAEILAAGTSRAQAQIATLLFELRETVRGVA